jgi:hypothetical protein
MLHPECTQPGPFRVMADSKVMPAQALVSGTSEAGER